MVLESLSWVISASKSCQSIHLGRMVGGIKAKTVILSTQVSRWARNILFKFWDVAE